MENDARSLSGLAMVFHELATNATKCGALKDNGGKVSIDWLPTPGGPKIKWTESGGPSGTLGPNLRTKVPRHAVLRSGVKL